MLEKLSKQLTLISGLIVTAGAIFGGLAQLQTNFVKWLEAVNPWLPWFVAGLTVTAFVMGVWLLVVSRSQHSNLLKPEALRLNKDDESHLAGREAAIEELFALLETNKIVCLEGESGSGKSALLRSGLIPKLRSRPAAIPLLMDIWSDDWEEGPAKALRRLLADNSLLAQDNNAAPLKQVEKSLAAAVPVKQPILMFDQFDDYQARNRARFLPHNVWLSPAALLKQNAFWRMIVGLIDKDAIRCLFVTRSDTAAGLETIKFGAPAATYRLDRVESHFIRPLIDRLTSVKDGSPVVENPEKGWTRLLDRIVKDLTQEGVVLPQQLRIVLLGLPKLRRLNVHDYDNNGGAAGVEALYVEKETQAAARKSGASQEAVRAILLAMTDPVSRAKTVNRSLGGLLAAARAVEPSLTEAAFNTVLEELERAEIMRTVVDPASGEKRFRLDHDYLSRGVIAADRRANRWHYLLRDGAKVLADSGGPANIRAFWRALLSRSDQLSLIAARFRGLFRYGAERGYAMWSLLRFLPVFLALLAVGAAGWVVDNERATSRAKDTATEIWAKVEFTYRGVGDSDAKALWILASTLDQRVREAFLEKLFDAPEAPSNAQKFSMGAAQLSHALTGLHFDFRETAARAALRSWIRSNSTDVKIAAVAMLNQLDVESERLPKYHVEAFKLAKNSDQIDLLLASWRDIGTEIGKTQAADFFRDIITMMRDKRADGDSVLSLAQAAPILATKIDEAQANDLFREIVATMKDNRTDVSLVSGLAKSAQALGAKINETQANDLAEEILATMKGNQRDGYLIMTLEQAVPALKVKIGKTQANDLAREILAAMKNNKINSYLVIAAQSLAVKIDESLATDLFNELVTAMKDNRTDFQLVPRLARAAEALAAKIDEKKASDLVEELVKAMEDNPTQFYLVSGLAHVAQGLVTKIDEASANDLSVEILTAMDNNRLERDLVLGLAQVAQGLVAKIDKAQTNYLATGILATMTDNRTEGALVTGLAQVTQGLATKIDRMQAADLFKEIVAAMMYAETSGSSVSELAQAARGLAAKINEAQANDLAREIVTAMKDHRTKSTLVSGLAYAAQGLAAKIDKAQAGKAFGTVLSLLSSSDFHLYDGEAVPALVAALVKRLPKSEQAAWAAKLLKLPAIYGNRQASVLAVVKELMPDKTGDEPLRYWEAARWLAAQPGVDVTSPPEMAEE